MSHAVALLVAVLVLVACGGGPAASPAGTPRTTAAPVTGTPAGGGQSPVAGGPLAPAALCALLTPEDWQQFNYVTGAEPDVTSDAPGSAVCQYARNLTFEVYVDATPEDAQDTYQTVIENAPFEDAEEVTLAGADEAQLDTEITDETSGIVVRAGRVTFTIGGPAREEAEAQLTTLAETVLQRISALR